MKRFLGSALALGLVCGGCGESETDASPLDAQPLDALPTDARPLDALPTDARPLDALPTDARPLDALPLDLGLPDAAVADAAEDALPVETIDAWDEVYWDEWVGPRRIRIRSQGDFILAVGEGLCGRTYSNGTLSLDRLAELDDAILRLPWSQDSNPVVNAPVDDDEVTWTMVVKSGERVSVYRYPFETPEATELNRLLLTLIRDAPSFPTLAPVAPLKVMISDYVDGAEIEWGNDLTTLPSIPWPFETSLSSLLTDHNLSFEGEDLAGALAFCEAGYSIGPMACGWFFMAEQDGLRVPVRCGVYAPEFPTAL